VNQIYYLAANVRILSFGLNNELLQGISNNHPKTIKYYRLYHLYIVPRCGWLSGIFKHLGWLDKQGLLAQ